MSKTGDTYIKIGEIRALINEQVKNPELVPIGFGKMF